MAVTLSPRGSEALSGAKVIVISRCAWTMYNFRLSLIKEIQKNGARVIALGAGDKYAAKLKAAGVDFREIPVSLRGLNPIEDLRLIVALVRVLAREQPDVVHCFTIKPAIYGSFAAKLCSVRARLVTITGLGHAFTTGNRWLAALVIRMYRIALERVHVVFFQNSEDKRLFLELGIVDEEISRVCAGSGVNLQRFAPLPLPLQVGERAPRFLMVARLLREKGVLEFVQAARMVHQRCPEVEFQLLGGEDLRNPSALSARELDDLRSSPVRWLGETDDVRPYFAQADVIVLPSYREGLPRTLLEAGAMGRPVIASSVPGCRDVVIDGVTGYLVPPQNAVALADAMLKLLNSPETVTEMGRAAHNHISGLFDERSVFAQTLNEYQRLIGTDR